MDLARDACPLLGDGAPELGELNRAPRADEHHDVREHAQEVALGDVVGREQRLKDEVEGREEHQREPEREPPSEVVAAAEEARAPADHGYERDERLQRERAGHTSGICVERPFDAPRHRGDRRLMKNTIHALHGTSDLVGVVEIGLDELDCRG